MYTDPAIDVALVEAQIKKHDKSECPEPLAFGVNIYTDGGCKNTNTGWGVHGFVYANTPVKTGCGVTGYTATNLGYILNDRLAEGNFVNDMFELGTRHPPACVQAQPFVYFDGCGSLLDSTNNIGETVAFIRALDLVERLWNELKISHVHFKIDSKYVINNILTRFKIIENNWCNRSGPIANQEYWQEAFAKLESLSHLPIRWTIEWVEGHSDSFGNIQADRLATMGRISAENGVIFEQMNFFPAQGRWGASGADTKSNPALYFMMDSKWYYDPLMEFEERNDGLVPLFVGNHEEHEHAGQPDAKSCTGIVLMKNPPKHLMRLVEVADKCNRIDNGYEVRSAFHATVNNILRPEFEDQLMSQGDHFTMINTDTKTVLNYDDREILRSFNPPFLSILLMNNFMTLHDKIDRVVAGQLMDGDCLTDVTDLFYTETVTSKNKPLLKVCAPNDASIKAKVGVNLPDANHVYHTSEVEITLSYGITAPRYRVFGGVKDYSPKVYVLTTYEPVAGFRYHTVMQISTGEWAIWTNPHGNLQII